MPERDIYLYSASDLGFDNGGVDEGFNTGSTSSPFSVSTAPTVTRISDPDDLFGDANTGGGSGQTVNATVVSGSNFVAGASLNTVLKSNVYDSSGKLVGQAHSIAVGTDNASDTGEWYFAFTFDFDSAETYTFTFATGGVNGSLNYSDIQGGIVPSPDGIVEGTTGDDIIDVSYAGDPQGDMVDNNDAVTGIGVGDEDIIIGGAGSDVISAGAADDVIEGDGTLPAGGTGPDGNDIIDAGAGNDTVYGGGGSDVIVGGDGDDQLFGGDGDDNLEGGAGDDTLTGGDGDDRFNVAGGNDTITDFNSGTSGTIDDGDNNNNDLVDLSAYYNDTTLAAYNAANPGNTYATPLEWLRADQADDGVLNDTEAGWTSDFTLTIQNGGSAVDGADLTFENTRVMCFTSGTLIKTIDGETPIEELSVGDRVLTLDNGYQPIRWIGARSFSSSELSDHKNLRPVRIRADALGFGYPEADLMVSQQHRVLISSKIARRMFDGSSEVLVAAKHLTLIDGIDIVEGEGVEYYHFLFDIHQIVCSNGAHTESLHTGPEALKAMSPEARKEILSIFPEVTSIDRDALPCRPVANGRLGRRLATRHRLNRKQLFVASELSG